MNPAHLAAVPCPLLSAGDFSPGPQIKLAAQLSPGLTAQWRLWSSLVNIFTSLKSFLQVFLKYF